MVTAIMKNFLIIGHSGGVGKALSTKLAQNARVYGTYFNNKPDFIHSNISSHRVDVLDDQPDLSFLPDTLDGLVYCTGSIVLKPFSRLKENDFLHDYRLQVTGAVKVIQQCIPALKKSEQASVVMFSTVAVKTGFNFHSLVSSSKGAIEGLTRALSAEFAPKIRVNCVAPSLTNTPLAATIINTPEKLEANAQRHPLRRIGEPIDIANCVAYLLSDDSSWVTGQVLTVDGGIGTIR